MQNESRKKKAIEQAKIKINPDTQDQKTRVKKEQETEKKPEEGKEAKSKFHIIQEWLDRNYRIRLNVISNELEYSFKKKDENTWIAWTTLNENTLYVAAQKAFIDISMSDLIAVLKDNQFIKEYNPITSYFETLHEWDGKIDHIDLLSSHVQTTEETFFKTQFKKMFVRTIAGAIDPNVFNKQIFVLVGSRQNTGKTTFLRFLVPPTLVNYTEENIATDKDGQISLTNNFIINMDELASLIRAEINSLKAFLSKKDVKVRRPYDKRPTVAPRTASFLGSVNNGDFLTDVTGSVRWICCRLKEIAHPIDWSYSKNVNINNVWSQAFSLYKNGFKYNLTEDELIKSENNNKVFQALSAEIELIQKFFSPGTIEQSDRILTCTELVIFLYKDEGITSNIRLTPAYVGRALTFLGFISQQVPPANIKKYKGKPNK